MKIVLGNFFGAGLGLRGVVPQFGSMAGVFLPNPNVAVTVMVATDLFFIKINTLFGSRVGFRDCKKIFCKLC